MSATNRRYDIDWIRVIAIGLLLIYHVAIGFQPWGAMIGFITTKEPWGSLWVPMSMLNVWRIPLLFFVSGMGVYFALKNRDWKGLLLERGRRILLPFVFGAFCIVPLHIYVWQWHYGITLSYNANPGHLWFLGNIFAYVLLLSPLFFYLKRNEDGKVANAIRRSLSGPWGLLAVAALLVAEVLIVRPVPFELYAMNLHGFFLGFLAFVSGFCFVLAGQGFLQMILKWRWLFVAAAAALFATRLQLQMSTPPYLFPIESLLWVLAVLAFGHRYLNRPGKALRYLSEAAYPVYILHMAFLYLGSRLIFPLALDVRLQFVLVLAFTVAACFGTYDLIRRTNVLRPLFGLKINERTFAAAKEANAI